MWQGMPILPKIHLGWDCVADARRPICEGGCVAVRAGQLEKDEGCAADSGASVFWCLWLPSLCNVQRLQCNVGGFWLVEAKRGHGGVVEGACAQDIQ